jgi:hypothetical protein
MDDGTYPGLSWERYRSIDRAHFSALKEIARSPMHYKFRRDNERDSAALSFGRTAHTAILEPERFERECVVWDERTASGRARPRTGADWEKFCADNAGRTIVKLDEFRFACAVRDAVRRKPSAVRYLNEGEPEVSILWHDAETGRPCKGRIDWLTTVYGIPTVVGLKTARDHALRPFSSQAARLLYHLQWAMYHDGYAALFGGREPRMIEIVVETSPPYDSTVYMVPPEVLEAGREDYRRLLARLDECERTNLWPGVSENEMVFELPAWMFDDAESGESSANLDEWGKGATDG